MDKEILLNEVEKLSPWFHSIELTPHRINTKEKSHFGEDPDHPQRTWSHVRKCFPDDLSGKTVLDIGCNAGFYSFEARKRNASFVLGVDATKHHVRQALFVKSVLGVDRIDFQRKSLYELDPLNDGQFDMVLALGLVYHLKHLILGLEILYRITRETLILESAIAVPEMTAASHLKTNSLLDKSELLKSVCVDISDEKKEMMPLFYVKNDAHALEAPENWFIPTEETLIGMLRDVGFSNIASFETFSGRAIICASKSESMLNSTRPAWLKAAFQLNKSKLNYHTNESVEIIIRVENRDLSTWLSQGVDKNYKGQVRLSAVLTCNEDRLFYHELHRVDIPHNIEMGGNCELKLCFAAPANPGEFILELDMVSEQVCFFQDVGSTPTTISFTVKD